MINDLGAYILPIHISTSTTQIWNWKGLRKAFEHPAGLKKYRQWLLKYRDKNIRPPQSFAPNVTKNGHFQTDNSQR